MLAQLTAGTIDLMKALYKRSPRRHGRAAGAIKRSIAENVQIGIHNPALIALIFDIADPNDPAGHR